MNYKQSLRWAGYYLALSTASLVLGIAFIAAGIVIGLADGYVLYRAGASPDALLTTAVPGLALAVLGLIVWRLGAALAFHKTVSGAVEEELSEQFDSERMKSEILAVLDDRLSNLNEEIERSQDGLRRIHALSKETHERVEELEEASAASGFEFGED